MGKLNLYLKGAKDKLTFSLLCKKLAHLLPLLKKNPPAALVEFLVKYSQPSYCDLLIMQRAQTNKKHFTPTAAF